MSTKTYNQQISSTVNNVVWEARDWGHVSTNHTELDALRIAYAHRNSKYGVQVRETMAGFSVTLFNERAAACGIDRS